MAPPEPVFARIEQAIGSDEDEGPPKKTVKKSKKKVAQGVAEA